MDSYSSNQAKLKIKGGAEKIFQINSNQSVIYKPNKMSGHILICKDDRVCNSVQSEIVGPNACDRSSGTCENDKPFFMQNLIR